MNNGIMVKAYASEHSIDFRTISKKAKSPHRFYILRSELARLEQEPYIVTHNICSFAVLRLDSYRGTLEIKFTWLRGSEETLTGRVEVVTLPYARLMEFVHDSTQEGGPKTWKVLSMDVSKRRPRLVFETRACLKIVNTPNRRVFFCHALLIFLEIHPVFLRQIGFA